MLKTILRRAKIVPGIMILLLVTCGIASAQSDGPSAKELGESINIMWMLIAGFLVFFMQAGFALVETGFTRAKNVSHTMMMNMMVFCIGAIGYWLVGFAFQFGAVNFTFPAINGLTRVGAFSDDAGRLERRSFHSVAAIWPAWHSGRQRIWTVRA